MKPQRVDSERLIDLMCESHYTSHDPYGALLSPLSNFLKSANSKRYFMHLVKILPNFCRQFFRVPKIQMATTLGQVLSAMTKSQNLKFECESDAVANLILSKQNLDGGWGYEFDVVLRWGSYKAGTSNLIATAVCAKALIEHGNGGTWINKAQSYIESNFKNGYFGYSKPGDPLIHNANLLGASTLSLLNGTPALITEAISTSVNLQKTDGSWPYGEEPNLSWVDNFHTAYVLEALLDLSKNEHELVEPISKGLEFWQSQLFISGAPKYFSSDTKTSTDINTLSAALSLVCHPLLERFAKGNLKFLKEGLVFQLVTALGKASERAPHFRWDYGPAALALAQAESGDDL